MFVDTQLPFGLAFVPAIYSSLGEGLEWILRRRGVRNVMLYLDDYVIGGTPNSSKWLLCAHVKSWESRYHRTIFFLR